MEQHLLLESSEKKEKGFLGSLNPRLRKLCQETQKNVSMHQYISVSLRCILTGQWKIYNWTDTGYSNLMHVTPVTHYHALWLWMPYLLEQHGVTLWEASCSNPFLRMTRRQDRLWQQPLWLCSRSLPPTRLPLLLSKCTRCHLSAYLPVP